MNVYPPHPPRTRHYIDSVLSVVKRIRRLSLKFSGGTEAHRGSVSGGDGPRETNKHGFFRVLLAGVILVGLLSTGVASADHKHRQCGDHPRKNLHERKKVIRCWAEKRGLDPSRVIRIGRCESGHDLLDDVGAGLYAGTFQHHKGYWPGRARAYGVAGYGVKNVWAQARVSTAMMRATGYSQHWPYCGRVA